MIGISSSPGILGYINHKTLNIMSFFIQNLKKKTKKIIKIKSYNLPYLGIVVNGFRGGYLIKWFLCMYKPKKTTE
jgi:hypothetical protein